MSRRSRGLVLWFTGLSGAGKSTVARALVRRRGARACWLDGDAVRQTWGRGLGFAPGDRSRLARGLAVRAARVSCGGRMVVVSAVSPRRRDRLRARQQIGAQVWREIHVATPLSVCERRGPSELYRRARAGELSQVCGIDVPYEAPHCPTLRLDAGRCSRAACLEAVLQLLKQERAA